MRKSKCKYCQKGIVFNEKCTKIIFKYFCDIDAWDGESRCQKNYCNYYKRKNESEVKNAANF